VRAAAARRVAANVMRGFHLRAGQHVALYAPLGEELDVAPLMRLAQRHGCHIYLPQLIDRRHRRMRFVEASGAMRRNRLGILEPVTLRARAARWLDLVFVPLVGFDATGMRLGMGAGYYDRAFAFRRRRHNWHKPRLVGLAYALQRVASIAAAPHDVRLDAVVTEEGVLACTTGC
jgi:5-formyltetrahydrofolate cyclo-ligase